MARRNAHDRSESPARSVVSNLRCACHRLFAEACATVACSCLPTMPKAKPTPVRLDAWARSELCTLPKLGLLHSAPARLVGFGRMESYMLLCAGACPHCKCLKIVLRMGSVLRDVVQPVL